MVKKHKTIPVFVPHLGCPQDCLFCDQKKITGEIKQVTAERVRELIRIGASHKKAGEKLEIGFFGGSFTGIPEKDQKALLTPAFEAKSDGLLDGIRLSTRPDYINDRILERLQAFGVTCVELGAQSMDDEVLTLARRGHTAAQTEAAAQAIKASGIDLGLQMMTGLPGDTLEKTLHTAERFLAMEPTCVRIYPTVVIRGTALAQLYEQGDYTPLTVEEAVERCRQLYHMFADRQIDIIRMGLLNMKQEDILAGPYHPSFGELVLSAACYDKLAEALQGYSGKTVQIGVHPAYVSVLCGHKRKNLLRLEQEFGFQEIKLLQTEKIERGSFAILPDNQEKAKS